MSNLFYNGWGWGGAQGAGSNLSILKEAKKMIWAGLFFFLGVGVHLLSPMENLYIL